MLSLRNILNLSDEEVAFRKLISIFLEKIGSGCVRYDTGEYEAFRVEMKQLQERADHETSPTLLFITAGAAVQAMENYNLRITGFLRKQAGELRSIVSMITETAIKLGGENARAAQRLQEIGNRFEQVGALEDLQALKAHLGDCLHSFREELQRQKTESSATIRALQLEIERRPTGTDATPPEPFDHVTGLPRQSAAITALETASANGKRVYVVAMVIKGVQSVNARFGFEVGDRMLCVFKESAERQLLRQDRMYRWDGPAIVVLMERTEPIAQTRANLRRILDGHLEESFDVDGRSVLIPIAVDWTAFPLVQPVANAVKQIRAFVAGQGSPVTSYSEPRRSQSDS